MSTHRQRLLELALRGLEAERERIENEIKSIQGELKRGRGGAPLALSDSASVGRRKPKFSAAERHRRSERMRHYWAARRGAKAAAGRAKSASATTSARRKPKFSAAERQRRAERMRQYWARRRASKK